MEHIDFIYVNYLSATDVITSIASLKRLLRNCHLGATIYVVDNSFAEGPPDDAKKILNFSLKESDNFCRIIYQPSDSNLGFGAACNKAALISSSKLIVFANCDTSFESTDADSFVNSLQLFQDESVSVVGPRVLDESGLLHCSCFSFDPVSVFLKPLRHVRKLGTTFKVLFPKYDVFKKQIDRITYEGMNKNSPCVVDWVSGCFMMVRREFFENVGGFDDRYFLYFEDTDICRKARQLGSKVLFDPTTSVTHLASHQSARGKGVMRSLVKNKATRFHIASWIKYCVKWRKDFFNKVLMFIRRSTSQRPKLVLGSSGKLSQMSTEAASYVLDFSTFSSYKENRACLYNSEDNKIA